MYTASDEEEQVLLLDSSTVQQQQEKAGTSHPSSLGLHTAPPRTILAVVRVHVRLQDNSKYTKTLGVKAGLTVREALVQLLKSTNECPDNYELTVTPLASSNPLKLGNNQLLLDVVNSKSLSHIYDLVPIRARSNHE